MAKTYQFTEADAARIKEAYGVDDARVDTWRSKGNIPASYMECRQPKQRTPGSGRKANPNRTVFWVVISDENVARWDARQRKEFVSDVRSIAVKKAQHTHDPVEFDFNTVAEFCRGNRVEVVFQDDQQFHCLIDGKTDSWAVETDAFTAMQNGVKSYMQYFSYVGS